MFSRRHSTLAYVPSPSPSRAFDTLSFGDQFHKVRRQGRSRLPPLVDEVDTVVNSAG